MGHYVYTCLRTSVFTLLLAFGTVSIGNVYANPLSSMISGVNAGMESNKQPSTNSPTSSNSSPNSSSIFSHMSGASSNNSSSGGSMPAVNPNTSRASDPSQSSGGSRSAVVPAGSSIGVNDLKAIIASVPRGQVLLVNFYASWCPPCVQELPHLVNVRKKFSNQDVRIIGINLDSSKAEMEKFNKRMSINYDTYHDASGNILNQLYKANSVPFNALYDKRGEYVFGESGFVDENFVTELLGIALR